MIYNIIYSISDDIDESELEAELEGLEDEWAEEETIGDSNAVPTYLSSTGNWIIKLSFN